MDNVPITVSLERTVDPARGARAPHQGGSHPGGSHPGDRLRVGAAGHSNVVGLIGANEVACTLTPSVKPTPFVAAVEEEGEYEHDDSPAEDADPRPRCELAALNDPDHELARLTRRKE